MLGYYIYCIVFLIADANKQNSKVGILKQLFIFYSGK
jgi:hypothetical protein